MDSLSAITRIYFGQSVRFTSEVLSSSEGNLVPRVVKVVLQTMGKRQWEQWQDLAGHQELMTSRTHSVEVACCVNYIALLTI